MGFNISGVVINKNYKDNFEDLQKALGWSLKRQGEINFEAASSNWKEDEICDVYFSDNGTLLFISMSRCEESWGVKDANAFTFILCEISMVFKVGYCENGIEKRSIIEVEDDRVQDDGIALAVEATSEDTSEIVWNQIAEVLGKPFWNIDSGEVAERYIFD